MPSLQPHHHQYARRCAELDYMLRLIPQQDIVKKFDRYRRYRYEILRELLSEKLIQFANCDTRSIRNMSPSHVDEVAIRKSYTVEWVNNNRTEIRSFNRRVEAESFKSELRKSFKVIDPFRIPKIKIIVGQK